MAKKLLILMVIMILAVSSIAAESDGPSTFDFGLLNYYRISNIADQDFATYTPGLRFEGHITPWFGIGTDIILDAPFAGVSGVYDFYVTTDLTFRGVIGFFEPFFAIGPAYKAQLVTGGNSSLDGDVKYSARAGFDFNITDIFTAGLEGKLILENIDGIVDGTPALADVDWLDATYVGITLKIKL